MIEHITIDGRQIRIGGRCHAPFNDFFSIDSMCVLIGENGSGKTRTLVSIAEMLTSGAAHGEHVVASNVKKNSKWPHEDGVGPVEELGVIYYSAVPFRRNIRKSLTLIEESCMGTRVREPAKMNLFRKIAGDLQPDKIPAMTAYISYPSSFIQRVIYPVLLERQVYLFDEDANQNLRRIRELKGIGREPVPRSDTPEYPRIAGGRELRMRELELFNFLRNWRQSSSTSLESLCYLAALNKAKPSNDSRGKALVRAFLVQTGIASVTPAFIDLRRYEKVEAIARETSLILSGLQALTFVHETDNETSFEIEDEYLYDHICRLPTAFEFRWENLSSGLLAIVEQFSALHVSMAKLRNRGCSSVLILLDEPDAFLHLDWQRRYIALLNKFLEDLKSENRLDCVQVLIASHSPVVAADMPRNMVQTLDSMSEHDVSDQGFKTFAAPIDDLIYHSFQSNSMGEYASKKIRDLYESAKRGDLKEHDHALISEIGDEGLKRVILNAGHLSGEAAR